MPQVERVLPADVYDALELSALAFGGIGAPQVWERTNNDVPCCIWGHSAFATGHEYSFNDKSPVRKALNRVRIDGADDSDPAVYAINDRRRRPRDSRVSFAAWCAELGVVRGK